MSSLFEKNDKIEVEKDIANYLKVLSYELLKNSENREMFDKYLHDEFTKKLIFDLGESVLYKHMIETEEKGERI